MSHAMDRKQRKQARSCASMRSMNDAYRHIERIMRGLQVPASQREPFIQWAIGRMWKEYRNELMNRRIDIENDIKS